MDNPTHTASAPQGSSGPEGAEASQGPSGALEAPRSARSPQAVPEAVTRAAGPQGEASTPDTPAVDRKTAREKIANLLWWSVPASTDEEAKERTEQLLDEHQAERDAEIVHWLVKKAREYRAERTKQAQTQADTAATLASKISRGAVRPNNRLMLPNPGFFEPDRTYTRQHHGETIRFFVEYVSTSPDGRTTVAHGWRHTPYTDGGWEPSTSDDFTGWTDATDAGEVSA